MTLMRARHAVAESDPALSQEAHEFRAAVILLLVATGSVKQDVGKIAAFVHEPRIFVRKIATNARRNGLWKNGKTFCEWSNKKHGNIAFWCDVAVVMGLLKRE